MAKRLKPDDRKGQIMDAALKVASLPGGWAKLTREAVAREAGCTDGLVSKYYGTMITFRRSIMRAAINQENLQVLAQGVAAGDPYAKKADPALITRALQTLTA